MHTGEEVCVDDFQANRAPDKRYRTTPLNGLWTHTKGGMPMRCRCPVLDNTERLWTDAVIPSGCK